MPDYQLFAQGSSQFEKIAVKVCRSLLGAGVRDFALGRDGGRDAAFQGTAEQFPSKMNPLKGKFIIQAKWSSNPVGKISDKAAIRAIAGEFPKIQKLRRVGELDHYLLFTSDRVPADAELRFAKKITKNTGVRSVYVLGREYITRFLDESPEIVKQLGLARIREPLRFYSDDIKKVIEQMHRSMAAATSTVRSKFDLVYSKLEKKNRINRLSKDYFVYIHENSEPYFPAIESFLARPINSSLRNKYYSTVDELRGKILAGSSSYASFDEIFIALHDQLVLEENFTALKRLVNPFLHFMYCSCDIGKK